MENGRAQGTESNNPRPGWARHGEANHSIPPAGDVNANPILLAR